MVKETKKQAKISNTQSGMVNYPLGDFLIRVKNAALGKKREVNVKRTKLIEKTAKVLKKEGYIDDIKEEKGKLAVRLAYRKKEPVILDLKLVSSPGLRIYWGVDDLEKKRGPSRFILSTPTGILFTREAIKKRVGGEVICEIW